uniref:Rho guanine nucleotide exchange factor (GEF) 17 n=1 Tax=Sphaerodactylus townsendi TaxID=933632 RepID=A0ACB8FG43_9SAUR
MYSSGPLGACKSSSDLLKHTPEEHPDHPFLIEAQRSIKQVAESINKGMRSAEEVERNARIVQEIESHIEGMEDLQAPLRRFLRQEMVVEMKAIGGKKDRSLFLFTDLLVCTTLKRKSGSLRRSSMSLYTAASVIDTTSKYKLLWKMPLEDVDIVKGAAQSTNLARVYRRPSAAWMRTSAPSAKSANCRRLSAFPIRPWTAA